MLIRFGLLLGGRIGHFDLKERAGEDGLLKLESQSMLLLYVYLLEMIPA